MMEKNGAIEDGVTPDFPATDEADQHLTKTAADKFKRASKLRDRYMTENYPHGDEADKPV